MCRWTTRRAIVASQHHRRARARRIEKSALSADENPRAGGNATGLEHDGAEFEENKRRIFNNKKNAHAKSQRARLTNARDICCCVCEVWSRNSPASVQLCNNAAAAVAAASPSSLVSSNDVGLVVVAAAVVDVRIDDARAANSVKHSTHCAVQIIYSQTQVRRR